MAPKKSREQYITDGLRTWTVGAGAMSVMCEGAAEEHMIELLNKEYDDISRKG